MVSMCIMELHQVFYISLAFVMLQFIFSLLIFFNDFLRPEQLWILNPQKLLRKLEKKKQTHSGAEAEALVSAKEFSIIKSGMCYYLVLLY